MRDRNERGGRDLWTGIGFGLVAALIWSGQISVSALGVRATLDATDIVALRVAVAGLLMLPLIARRGLAPLGWWRALVLALCAGPAYALTSVGGLAYAPAVHNAVIISGLSPLLATAATRVLFGSYPSTRSLAGLALIVAGVLAIAGRGLWVEIEPGVWIGDASFLGGAVLLASYTVAAQRWRAAAGHTTAVVAVLSMLYLPGYVATAGARLAGAPLNELLLQAGYQGVLAALVSIYCFTRAVVLLGAAAAALFIALVPVFGTLLAVGLLDEIPSAIEWLGMFATAAGVALALSSPAPRGPSLVDTPVASAARDD